MNVSQIINVQAKAIEKGYSSMVYVKPYILTLQWANREDAIAYIKKVKLNNGQSLCFNQKTVEYAENQNLLKAVTKELNKCNQKLPFSTKCSPVLTAVNGPYQKSASALSTDFYNKRNIAFFSATIHSASKELASKQVYQFAKRAYKDNRIDFFCVLIDHLSKSQKKEFKKQAMRDKKQAFYSVLGAV